MKKQIVITAVLSLLVGVILTAVGYSVYLVVSMEAQVRSNTATINEIVTFLQNATAPANKANATATE
jgi:hypothetical protein